MNYIKKAEFYKEISKLKNHWGFDDVVYGIDFVALCKQRGIQVFDHPFTTPGLRGMACLGRTIRDDIVILNTNRNRFEQNIDCAHEFIHLNCHRDEGYQSFNCFEKAPANQNKYFEWQANEGGAELVVPYRSLLPKIKKNHKNLDTYYSISYFKEELIQEYKVTEAVISYRLESLKYEIEQYINGVPIEDIKFLSLSAQAKQNINVKSLNTIAFEDLNNSFEAMYDLAESEWIACQIIQDWEQILSNLGGIVRASLCDTVLKSMGDNCFCIVFKNYSNYLIGNRPSIINELERYVLEKYKESVRFNTQLNK